MSMKTIKKKVSKSSSNVNKMIERSKAWVLLSLNKDGFNYHSSQQEDGLVLMALALASNSNDWEIVKEYVDSVKYNGQTEINQPSVHRPRLTGEV